MDKQKNMNKQNEQVITTQEVMQSNINPKEYAIDRAGLMTDCIMQIDSVEIIEEK